jgi:hypothetical protein
MTNYISTTSGSGQPATDKAHEVASHAKQAGGDVAQTAKEQGREVAHEAKVQARDLYHQARGHLTDQAGQQQQRAVGGLRSLAEEMRSMAEQGGQSGPVSELARQAADRVHGAAGWLEQRQPGDLVAEVRDYARRNPGTFLIGAAVLGVLAGRLTRGVAAASDSQHTVTGPRHAGSFAQPVPVQPTSGYDYDRDYERTAVLPPATPPAEPVAPAAPMPPAGYPAAAPVSPFETTDPLPGVPTNGVRQ